LLLKKKLKHALTTSGELPANALRALSLVNPNYSCFNWFLC
jgi:hypothetical protein